MARHLRRGRWIIARWEGLPHRQAVLRDACTYAGFEPLFIDLRRRSLTVVVNADLPVPADEQIQESIATVEVSRFTNQPITSL
jgi:hypothetical protein